MSLVPPTQHPGHSNGSSIRNGVISPAPTLGEGFDRMQSHAANSQAFDFWGFLQRRKYLVALFCLIGAGLGYLNYIKSPKTYSSNMRLLISTKAPPSIVNGNILLSQKSSIPNHSSLLVSEVVLDGAVREGGLERLNTFSATGNAVGLLKSMVRVIPEKGDTLRVSCSGPEPDDLPKILNEVVESYRRIVVGNSQSVSTQTVELIEALAGKLSDEKEDLVTDRLKLWKELDISSINEAGTVINPHTRKLNELRTLKDELDLSLSDVRLRSAQLIESASADDETGVLDPLKIRIAAMEAREYLKTNGSRLSSVQSAAEQAADDSGRQLQTMQQRVWEIETAISDLRAQLLERSQVVGAGHRDILALKKRIEFRERQASKLTAEMDELRKTAAASSGSNAAEGVQAELETLRIEEDKDWIRMYLLALEKQEQTLLIKLNQATTSINAVSKLAAEVGEKIMQLNVIQKTITKKEQAVDVILDRLKEMNVLADNYTMTEIKTLDNPKIGYQIAPSITKCIATGAMLATLCGLGLAFLIDQSELAFRSPTEILDHLQLPVVGKIPRIRTNKIKPAKGNAELIAAHNPAASESEAFRDIRTSLFFRSNNEDLKTILMTSPSPGDGKSTTAANLAISIAQAGKRVVLVDADFRRPRIDRYFGEDLDRGLLNVMSGEIELSEAIKPTELQNGLFLLTAGGHPKNPGELVTSEAFRSAIAALREQFDYVLIDSPPVLAVSDSVTIASVVDGVYMVSRIRKGVKLTARKAKDSLDTVNARWMGLIVNDVDQNPYYHEYGYQYGGYSYYGSSSYRTYYESDKVMKERSRITTGK